METNTAEQHSLALQSLCRVCGRHCSPAKKRRAVYKCVDHSSDLNTVFSIDVASDSPLVHPKSFCQACKGKIYNHKKGKIMGSTVNTKEWHPHQDVQCPTCLHYTAVQRGGRPSKTYLSRPSLLSRPALSHTPPSLMTVQEVLQKPADLPLSPTEMSLQTALAKRALVTGPGEGTVLQMKTGGQVYSNAHAI